MEKEIKKIELNQKKELVLVTLSELTELQGSLKKGNDESYKDFKERVVSEGIKYVFFFWEDTDKNKYIIDGHRRKEYLLKLQDEGYVIPKEYPALPIEATSKKEAAKELLFCVSNYGKITQEGFLEYLEIYKLKPIEIKNVYIKPISLNSKTVIKKLELAELNKTKNDDLVPDKINRITKSGDLWELNEHRLLCMDSTKEDDVAKLLNEKKVNLVFTDPPYNVGYAEYNKERTRGKDWTDTYCPDTKDNMSREDYTEFLFKVIKNIKQSITEWAHIYIWFAFNYFHEITSGLKENNINYDNIPIIWKKQTMPISWARYHRNYEPCLFAGKGVPTNLKQNMNWWGTNNETCVWEIDTDFNNDYIHPTQKPVALAVKALNNSSAENSIVMDLFGGSGSTLIGCEKTARTCFLMEKSEYYCDQISARWIKWMLENKAEIKKIKLNGKTIDYKEIIKE